MAALTDYLETALNNHLFGGGNYSPASFQYVALFTSAPNDGGGGTEAGGDGYDRVEIANNNTTWPSTSSNSKSNGITITFPTAGTSGWGTVTHFGIYDSPFGGNLLAWAPLTASRAIANTDVASFAAGALVISLASGGLGDSARNGLLNLAFGSESYARPSTLYVGAFTAPPSYTGGGTEVTGGSYERAPVTNNTTNFPGASAGTKANATTISFPAATATWGSVTDLAVFDSATGGSILAFDSISSVTISSGNTLRLTAGQLSITLD